jgi:microcystin degradation protein MlrC
VTNRGPRRASADGEWSGRLTPAREFHESARSLVTLAQSKSCNGAITLMVTATIAYADAITAKRKGVVNKQDHQTAVRLLREALGNGLPDKQEKFFRRLLGRKDEVNDGARSTMHDEAARLLAELDDFATWAEGEL